MPASMTCSSITVAVEAVLAVLQVVPQLVPLRKARVQHAGPLVEDTSWCNPLGDGLSSNVELLEWHARAAR